MTIKRRDTGSAATATASACAFPVDTNGRSITAKNIIIALVHVYELSSEDRKQLHLAAVFACNFCNHCFALSAELLQKHGLPFSVMYPLINETVSKAMKMPPVQAQTGPAVRGDENVMQKQQQLLADQPLMRDIYRLMSQSIQKLSQEQQ